MLQIRLSQVCAKCVRLFAHASCFAAIHKKSSPIRFSMLRGRHITIIQRTAISRFSVQHGLFRRQGKGGSPRVMNVAVKVAIA